MKIYTKNGDKGQTSLLGGVLKSKSDIRIETYGSCDTLNSHIGFARSLLLKEFPDNNVQSQLVEVQKYLFTVGSHLASEKQDRSKFKIPSVDKSWIQTVESWIDQFENDTPKLTNFIIPGGGASMGQSYVQVVRTECRSLERKLTRFLEQYPGDIDEHVLATVNRLSDYFFVLSRYIGHQLKIKETIWP